MPATIQLKESAEIKLPAHCLGFNLAPGEGEAERLVAACYDGGVYVVDAAGGPPRAVARHGSYASGAHWLPGQNAVLSAGYDGKLIWSDAAEGKPIREWM